MEKIYMEELEESMKEAKEVKKAFCLDGVDEALLLLIYNEMINHDSLLRDLPSKE